MTLVVEDLLHFSSFEEMAKSLPKEKIGFENCEISQIVDVYHQFYSKNDESKYGVLAIKIKI